MMPIKKLRQHYKNSLTKYFKRNPITNCNAEFSTKTKLRFILSINEGNSIDDVRFLDNLSHQCQLAIENEIDRASQQNIFDGSKTIKVEFELTQF